MNRHILFYSNSCPHSKEFISLLDNTSFSNSFIRVCVDQRNLNIPRNITSVPTIMVPEMPNPLTGDEVFMWISQHLNKDRGVPNNSPNNPPNNPPNTEAIAEGPTPFLPYEMSSARSDTFSFIESDPNFGTPLLHNYSFLNGPVENTNSQSPKEDDALEKMRQSRDNDPNIRKQLKRL